jgi:phage FluMu protein Com
MLYIGVLGCPFCRKVNVMYWCVKGVHLAGKGRLCFGVLGCPFCRKVNVMYWCVRVSILQEPAKWTP